LLGWALGVGGTNGKRDRQWCIVKVYAVAETGRERTGRSGLKNAGSGHWLVKLRRSAKLIRVPLNVPAFG
jgi:hypothetical protein